MAMFQIMERSRYGGTCSFDGDLAHAECLLGSWKVQSNITPRLLTLYVQILLSYLRGGG